MNVPVRRTAVALLGSFGLLFAACGSSSRVTAASSAPPSTTASTVAPATTTTAPDRSATTAYRTSGRNVNAPTPVGEPTDIEIPSIGVRSHLLRLGLAPDGTALVPGDPQVAGWFTGGPRPGAEGPAIILGHIDSRTGPAIFYRLHELTPGKTVSVRTKGGGTETFRVNRVKQVSKQAFPTAEVYGPAQGRQLRLITCGGTFDRSVGHYRDNVIVFLTATSPRASR